MSKSHDLRIIDMQAQTILEQSEEIARLRKALENICDKAPGNGEDVSYLVAKKGLEDEPERD